MDFAVDFFRLSAALIIDKGVKSSVILSTYLLHIASTERTAHISRVLWANLKSVSLLKWLFRYLYSYYISDLFPPLLESLKKY